MGELIERYREELRNAAVSPLDLSTLAQVRAGFDQLLASFHVPCAIEHVVDRNIGSHALSMQARVYGRNAAAGPAILFFHGGGFILGSIDSHDGFCRALVSATRIPVVSVGYRLAPEHRYPAAVEDGYTAARWLIENHASLGVRPDQIVVMGDSAGGYLATKVAARFPEIALQILLYPALDLSARSGSHLTFGKGYGLDREMIDFCYDCFLGPASRATPEVSPLSDAACLGGAPAIVVVAEADPLHDEGILFARRMSAHGRGAALWEVPDTVHGFAANPAMFPQARTLLGRLSNVLHRTFSDTGIDYTSVVRESPGNV